MAVDFSAEILVSRVHSSHHSSSYKLLNPSQLWLKMECIARRQEKSKALLRTKDPNANKQNRRSVTAPSRQVHLAIIRHCALRRRSTRGPLGGRRRSMGCLDVGYANTVRVDFAPWSKEDLQFLICRNSCTFHLSNSLT